MALFENLTARLSRTVDTLRGRGRITEENVGESLREVRMALLEADVALPVVKTFIERVRQKALGADVTASLTPGQAFVGILHRELIDLMSGTRGPFELRAQPPVVLLLAGWTLAAGSLHVVRTNNKVIVIPKNRIHYKDTYVDVTRWTSDDLATHPAIVERLRQTGKSEVVDRIEEIPSSTTQPSTQPIGEPV